MLIKFTDKVAAFFVFQRVSAQVWVLAWSSAHLLGPDGLLAGLISLIPSKLEDAGE